MAIQDDLTPNRGYPEPYKDNLLADDVARLRTALEKLDTDIAGLFLTFAGFAPLDTPVFIGEPTAPTANSGDASGQLATTAFVAAALGLIDFSSYAPILSPQFLGTPTAGTAAQGDNSNSIATTGFVAAAISALTDGAPTTLNTIAKLAAAIGSPTFAADVTAILNDPWALFPIGVPVPIYKTLTGVAEPPINKAYRYIKLSAADAYNSGVLGSESVSGSAPIITATGVITLANSPLVGQVVRLLNTETRFIRPGLTGTLLDGQNALHSHGLNDPGHGHSISDPGHAHTVTGSSSDNGDGGGNFVTSPSGAWGSIGTGGAGTGIAIVWGGSNLSLQSSGGNETRPRSMSFDHYLRIR